MKQRIETSFTPRHEKIELEPFGLTAGVDQSRPVMLFREKGGESILPVWLSPLDAGIALTQHGANTFAMSPHDVTLKALSVLGVKAETCEFIEVKGHQQYAELHFSGSKLLENLRTRADHAVSFCLQAKTRFFCTRAYLERCRDVEAELNRTQLSASGRAESRRPRSAYLN